MANRCIVPNCSSGKMVTNRPSFHRLPSDAARRADWLRLIKNPKLKPDTPLRKLKDLRVCSLHFREEDFDGDRRAKQNAAIRRLKNNVRVKPSIFERADGEKAGTARGDCGDAAESDPAPAAESASTFDQDVSRPRSRVEDRDQLDQFPSSKSGTEEDEADDCEEKTAVVYQSKILELFKVCHTCRKPISRTRVHYFGALMSIKWGCAGGHSGIWSSSPALQNFLTAVSQKQNLEIQDN